MSFSYIDNIYQVRRNTASVKLTGLEDWLVEHDLNLKAKRVALNELHAELLQLTKEAVNAKCDDLSDYVPYLKVKEKLNKAENDFTLAISKACQRYCREKNYSLYACNYCQDQGYLIRLNGQVKQKTACPNCFPELCLKYLKSMSLWQVNHSLHDDYSLDKPSLDIYRTHNTQNLFEEQKDNYLTNYRFCKHFADAVLAENKGRTALMLNETKNVYITGAAGTGKSYLAAKMAEYVVARGVLAIFITADTLVDLYRQKAFLQTTYAPNLRQLDYINNCFKLLFQAPLLVLDDLGAYNLQVEHLLNLCNNLQANQHLVLTTNMSHNDLVKVYGERVFSRLMHKAETINFITSDLRLPIIEGANDD